MFEKERATKKININITYLHLQTTFFNKESKFLSQEKVSEVIQKVPLLRRGGRVTEKRTKQTGRMDVLACAHFHLFKKNAEIFKMKLYSYSLVFPIDYNGTMKY